MMNSFKALARGHPLLSYFTLTFVISWGGVFMIVGPDGFPARPEQISRLLPFVVLATLAGPSLAGILLTGLVHGRTGYRELKSRLLRRQTGAGWYVVALLTAPLLVTSVLMGLSLISTEFLPGIFTSNEKTSLLLIGIAYGLWAGVFEETGWTGFAIPEMRLRRGVLATGLIVGFIWGAWHMQVAFLDSGSSSGAFSLTRLLPWIIWNVGVLPAYRVLMMWVYDRSGSLLVAMFMHASLTASLPMILMPAAKGMALFTFYLLFAVVLWSIVAAIGMTRGWEVPQRSLQSQKV